MKKCPICGSTFDDILKKSVGCVSCYDIFAEDLCGQFRLMGFKNIKIKED